MGQRWGSNALARQRGKGGERLRDASQGELILLIKAASSQGLNNLSCCRLFTAVEFNTPMNKAPGHREGASGLLTLLHGTRGFRLGFDVPEPQAATAPPELSTYVASTQARPILGRKSTQSPFKHLDGGEHLLIKQAGQRVVLGCRGWAGLGAVSSARWCCIDTTG